MQETLGQFLGQEDPLEKDRLPTPVFLGFPGGSDGKESAGNMGDLGSIPGLGKSPGEGTGYPLQCFGLENSMEWIVHTWPPGQDKIQCYVGNHYWLWKPVTKETNDRRGQLMGGQ